MARDAERETELTRAITWLEEYGGYGYGPEDIGPTVSIRTTYASACHGSKEAYAVLEGYVVRRWSDFVDEALADARLELAKIHKRHGVGSDGS